MKGHRLAPVHLGRELRARGLQMKRAMDERCRQTGRANAAPARATCTFGF
jgi:hypothetical protein